MVPLTASLYVPGTLGLLDEVLVDIGTGYYVGAWVAKRGGGQPTSSPRLARPYMRAPAHNTRGL